jgi:hypothetical protein
MQLIKKLFGQSQPGQPGPDESVQFQESQANTEIGSRNAPRRELIQVVLRDSMRRHGIPSAWIDCRILPVMSRTAKSGMHVQFIVRDGTDRLLTYVPAFQRSFMTEVGRFDPRVEDWLFSLSWQFVNLTPATDSVMPDPKVFAAQTLAVGSPQAAAAPAAVADPQPTAAAAVTAAEPPAPAEVDDHQDVMDDLQALYAIRDAALRQGRPSATGPAGEQDFENTRPAEDSDPSGAKAQQPRRW